MRDSFPLVILQLVLKILILPLFFIIIGGSEQRDVWRQHCNVKNLITQTSPNKQAHHPLRLFGKVWIFFPKQLSGEESCTDFSKMPTSIYLSGRSASYSLESCLWISEESSLCMYTEHPWPAGDPVISNPRTVL